MSVERAKADLAKLDEQAVALKRQIAEIDRRADRLRTYIMVAQEYDGGGVNGSQTSHALSQKGITEVAVEATIGLLRAEGKPIHTRVLLSMLASQGISIGGSNPVANLSGFLSREKTKLRNSRMDGWHLREWDVPLTSTKNETSTISTEDDPSFDPDLANDETSFEKMLE